MKAKKPAKYDAVVAAKVYDRTRRRLYRQADANGNTVSGELRQVLELALTPRRRRTRSL